MRWEGFALVFDFRFRAQTVGAVSKWVEQELQPCSLHAVHSWTITPMDSFKFLTLAQPNKKEVLSYKRSADAARKPSAEMS